MLMFRGEVDQLLMKVVLQTTPPDESGATTDWIPGILLVLVIFTAYMLWRRTRRNKEE